MNTSNTPNMHQGREPDIRQAIEGSREILIALGRTPSFDTVASGLSLYLALSSAGKRVTIVSPSPMTVEFNHLIGIDKITNNVSAGGRNLIVSFPYQEGSIEKVSYNIENDTFNLVIEPREGYTTITPENLRYSFGGGTFDTVITVGAASLSDLDGIYTQNQNLFHEKQLINIDINPGNQRYGKVNAVDPNASSLSEMTANMLNALDIKMDSDIATNLLAGITIGTNNFSSPKSGPVTFEAAALCMRNGARKVELQTQPYTQPQPYQFPTQYNQSQEYQPAPAQSFNQPPRQVSQPPNRPQHQPLPGRMQTQSQLQYRPQPRPMQQPQAQSQQQKPQQKGKEAPPDWLKPKIYKGSTLL